MYVCGHALVVPPAAIFMMRCSVIFQRAVSAEPSLHASELGTCFQRLLSKYIIYIIIDGTYYIIANTFNRAMMARNIPRWRRCVRVDAPRHFNGSCSATVRYKRREL